MSVYVQTNQVIAIPNAAAYAVSAADTGKIHKCPRQLSWITLKNPGIQMWKIIYFTLTIELIFYSFYLI